jgi:hypothetical protein
MRQQAYPTIAIAVFSAVCVVLTVLAGSISNPATAASAVAILGIGFFLGLLGFQARAGWIRQGAQPRGVVVVVAMLVFGAGAVAAAAYLETMLFFRSVWRLPVGLLAILGIGTLAGRLGALCRIVRERSNRSSDASSEPGAGADSSAHEG